MSSRSRRGPGQSPRSSAGSASRSGNPARRQAAQPSAPPARRTLERLSAPVLVTLHGLPRWLVPIVMAVALFGGLVLTGPWSWFGAILLLVVGVFVSWLTALSWPILTPPARAIRVVVAGVLFGLAVFKALGKF